MSIRDLFFPFILALSSLWLFNYFFFAKKDATQYQFTAPQSAVECAPLNRAVVLSDEKRMAPKIEAVETEWGALEFSTNGAVVTRLEFKRAMNGKQQIIGTIFPAQDGEINQAFLVAFDEHTPFTYRLADRHETDMAIELTFAGSSDSADVRKRFVIYKTTHQMDLAISIAPKKGAALHARLLYPSPLMPALKNQNQAAGDLIIGSDTFKKIYKDSIKLDTFWVHPPLFGVENKYFMYTLIRDSGFVQRAYYGINDENLLTAFVEGPAISEKQEWTLSFYLGPKEGSAMRAVDHRLEWALDYSGFWAPISRLLLMILNWLFRYVYNYGWAIVLLTILIKLLLLPFSIRADRGVKERLDHQKRLQYIKQKYKDDPQARMQAEMEFMKKYGLGLGGCLPMFAQVPIFFGLSRVLASSIELYGAPFLWMKDLSAPDPYYILPILIVIGTLFSVTTSTDPKQRLPMIIVAIGFGAFSTTFSAGLVLYLALNGLLSVVQTRIAKLFA